METAPFFMRKLLKTILNPLMLISGRPNLWEFESEIWLYEQRRIT